MEETGRGHVWAAVFDTDGWQQARRDMAVILQEGRAARRGEWVEPSMPPERRGWLWLAWRLQGLTPGAGLGRTVRAPGGSPSDIPAGWVFVVHSDGQMAVGDPVSGHVFVLMPVETVQ